MSHVELRYGRFGAYFYDDETQTDLGLGEVLIRLNDEVHIRSEAGEVLRKLDELALQWGDEAVFRRCREQLRKAINFQSEPVAIVPPAVTPD